MNVGFTIKGEGEYMGPEDKDAVSFGKPQSIDDIANADGKDEGNIVEKLANDAVETVIVDNDAVVEAASTDVVPDQLPTQADVLAHTVVDTPTLSESDKPGFNPLAKQDARVDSEDEGGVSSTGRHSLTPTENVSRYIPEVDGKKRRAAMVGNEKADGLQDDGLPEGGVIIQKRPHQDFADSDDDGAALQPGSPNIQEKERPNSIELSGFSVTQKFKQGNRTVPVLAFYNDKETAMATVSGDKYLAVIDGSPLLTSIVNGKPIVIKGDRQIMEYVNGSWRKV